MPKDKTKDKTEIRRSLLQNFTFGTGMVHLLSAMIATIVSYVTNMNDTLSLQRNFVVWPADGASGPFTFTHATGMSVMLRWPVILFFTLSFVYQIAVSVPDMEYTRNHLWSMYYSGCIIHGVQPLRWVEYSFSASFLMVLVAALNGVNDFHFMILIFFCTWTLMMLGLVQELYAKVYRQSYMSSVSIKADSTYISFMIPHFTGWILHAVVWLLMWDKFVMSVNETAPGAWVYAFFGFVFTLYTSFGIVQLVQMSCIYVELMKILPDEPVVQNDPVGFYKAADAIVERHSYQSEFAYVSLSLVCKSVTAWILFGGIGAAASKNAFS